MAGAACTFATTSTLNVYVVLEGHLKNSLPWLGHDFRLLTIMADESYGKTGQGPALLLTTCNQLLTTMVNKIHR
eukprot:CAMPEP_0172679828 /NCGR_PEP_ID=MMETSP1074-20121228/16333_1 /TAXON_ID=2916 /ORGANISM="Ceratium fusus, Strain PA161109" /LENGTH=73 /DNA_ID=CAMNT_0013498065 /DNA_START=396 /DNA_END=617 /DNA_ORIENTATION=-